MNEQAMYRHKILFFLEWHLGISSKTFFKWCTVHKDRRTSWSWVVYLVCILKEPLSSATYFLWSADLMSSCVGSGLALTWGHSMMISCWPISYIASGLGLLSRWIGSSPLSHRFVSSTRASFIFWNSLKLSIFLLEPPLHFEFSLAFLSNALLLHISFHASVHFLRRDRQLSIQRTA